MDVTEIPGADNLFQAEGIIRDVQERYATLYGVARSYLLVNGSSAGIIAAVLASVRPGKQLIMARNCHKSVFNALSLGGLEPVFARPASDREYGVSGAIPTAEIERLLAEYPDADAVILPSPNYYGICSDIRAIADATHRAGKILIADQAHGAHLKFFKTFGFGEGMPPSAEDCGADIAINSIHKTLASFTQSALLNLNSDRVDRRELEDRLQAIESTSPSYILMASLDINAEILETRGAEVMRAWKENILYFREEAEKISGLEVMHSSGIGCEIHRDGAAMDITKINLNMGALGIDGARLEKLLIDEGIFPELYAGDLLMLMTGIGNTRAHMGRTLRALERIAANDARPSSERNAPLRMPEPGKFHAVPRKTTLVSASDAAGRICARSIIPYPPGIPLACPGEEITPEIAQCARALRDAGEKVLGVDDLGRISVGAEES
jgi:lysine decarboxylase